MLCDDVTAGRSSSGTCSTNKTIHVRQAEVIVLSSSYANIFINAVKVAATATASVTADTASGSNTLTNVSVSAGGLAAGQILSGPGIPAGTGIRSVSASAIVMNAPATATAAGITVAAIDSHIDLPACNTISGNVPDTFMVTVVDVNGNAMPVGSTVAFSTSNGTITSDASYIVPDTIACRTGYTGCPATAASANFGDIPVTMKSDATFTQASAEQRVWFLASIAG